MYDLSFVLTCFKINELKYTGIDGSICKCVLKAVRSGTITDRALLGFEVTVVCGSSVINEVKRMGYFKDREMPMQLRVGDTLVIYMSNCLA